MSESVDDQPKVGERRARELTKLVDRLRDRLERYEHELVDLRREVADQAAEINRLREALDTREALDKRETLDGAERPGDDEVVAPIGAALPTPAPSFPAVAGDVGRHAIRPTGSDPAGDNWTGGDQAGSDPIGHVAAGSDPIGHDPVGGAVAPPVLDIPAEPPASPTSLAQIAKRIWNAADPVTPDADPAAEQRPTRPDSSTTFPMVRYGYERSEVQAYVDWFENYLRDPAAAGHVPLARFHVVEVGYELGAVDAYCDRVTRVLRGLGPIDGDLP